jgi:hypothetical protein
MSNIYGTDPQDQQLNPKTHIFHLLDTSIHQARKNKVHIAAQDGRQILMGRRFKTSRVTVSRSVSAISPRETD